MYLASRHHYLASDRLLELVVPLERRSPQVVAGCGNEQSTMLKRGNAQEKIDGMLVITTDGSYIFASELEETRRRRK